MPKIKLTPTQKKELETVGTLAGGTTGGPQKNLYYTPDGREIWAIPGWRTRGGRLVDCNYDKGWLPVRTPENMKQLYCRGCDRWHPTQKEVDTCIASKNKFVKIMAKKAIKEPGKNGDTPADTHLEDRVKTLETNLTDLNNNIKLLLQKMGGS